jgi:small subunit ribosomal protein S6
MPYYETVFIARQDLAEAQVKTMVDRFTKIITDQGGKVHKTENWGLRNLAYRIKKNRKGHYVLIETDAPPAAVIELERNLRLDEDVLRSLTVRLEAQSDGPSVMMEKPGRDDRSERSDRYDRSDRPDRSDRSERPSREKREAA